MSTKDVPGANPANHDVLAMGCWAEHSDGSLIFVEAVEGDDVVYSIFDLTDPPVEYRDGMEKSLFERRFSHPSAFGGVTDDWTWHDKTLFPWERVMGDFPAGQRHPSAVATLTAAQRVARSLDLRAERVLRRDSHGGRSMLTRLGRALEELRR